MDRQQHDAAVAQDAADTVARTATDVIAPPSVELPAHPPTFSRSDMTSLAIAAVLHAAFIAAMLEPDRRIGAGGRLPEAIGVDLVVLADAMEGRTSSNARKAAAGPGIAAPGEGETSAEQAASADLRQSASTSASSPAPLSQEPILPGIVLNPTAPAEDPTGQNLAAAQPAVSEDVPRAMPPAATSAPFMSPMSSAPSAPAEATDPGIGQLGGGRSVDVTTAALALARAGRRDRYGAAVYAVLRDNLPAHVPGAAGKVTVEFTIASGGSTARPRIALSSGNAALDAAALAAVRAARFPEPPPEIPARDLTYTMEYTFADERNSNGTAFTPPR